ncbi:MAG: serine hydroxymethyltransferase [candidate division WOR-3 bacterium]|nr:serine hydroxymethyltransferase [candidate division WOR-3 bacterium]MCX7947715.1 serine hydroxymethyltransferase [candidate division WOR-3 bacterium]MDW8150362.1 serine hydroxymethyltransferase [candidate division WOR-3 bacterium]
MYEIIKRLDPQIYEVIIGEIKRQEETLEMIASENYPSLAVLLTMATPLNNKYAEGYPNRRYYGGCEFVDQAEILAQERAKILFDIKYVNVQPHSGSQANMAVYFSLLEVGDTILSMELSHGGHLSHGAKVSFSGKFYNVIYYGVNPNSETIDFDLVYKLAREYKPKLIIAGYSSYPRIIDWAKFREIADEVNAYFMADIAHIAGLIVGNVHPSPKDYAHVITTTTHKTLRGPRGGMILTNNQEISQKIDKNVFPGIQGGPFMHVIASKAVAFKEAMKAEFKEYAMQIVKNSKALAESLMEEGLRLVSGGTDNHLVLVDLRNLGITGKEAEKLLEEVGITVNKNTIPFDPQKPTVTSGIRIGTPILTTRGMKEEELRLVGKIIAKVIKNQDDRTKSWAKGLVKELTNQFPFYRVLL